MQESPPTSFQFRDESEVARQRSKNSRLQSYLVPFVTGVVVLLALASVPLFGIALRSVGLPSWLGFIPLLVVTLFLVGLFAVKLRNPAERTHGKHTGTNAENVLRRHADAPHDPGINAFLVMLDSLTDASWAVFRDVQIPNTTELIEAVLVGNTGIYVIQMNTDSGTYRLRDGLWEWQDWHDRWRVDQKNPLMWLHRKRDDIEYFLHANRVEAQVKPRLVWAGQGKIDVPPETEQIWFTDDGGDMIWQDLHRGRVLPAATIERVCMLLEQISAQ